MATLNPSILLSQTPVKPPSTDFSQTFVDIAKLKAYQQQQRLQELQYGQAERAFSREDAWRQAFGDVFASPAQQPGQGLTAPQGGPLPVAGPPPGQGLTAPMPPPGPPSMAAQVPPPAPGQGPYGLAQAQPTLTPGAQDTLAYTRAPADLQPQGITAMGQPPGMNVGMREAGPPLPQGITGMIPGAQASAQPSQGLTAAPPPGQGVSGMQAGQSALPELFPQVNQQALMRAFALDPTKTAQAYSTFVDMQGKKLEQVERTNDLVYQALLAVKASPNPQEAYTRVLADLREKGVPTGKNLPPTLDPAWLDFQIGQHRTLKTRVDEAKIQQAKAAAYKDYMEPGIRQQELGIKQAQAGYQGLGEGVTSILKGLTPEQVEQFGGRHTPAAIAYATEQEKQRKLEQGKAAELQRGQTERELRGEKTVSEVMGTKATNLFDTKTMEPVDTRMKQKDYEALPAGQVRELSPQLTEQLTNIRTSVPIIAQLQGHIDKIYGPGGVLARMTPDERADLAAVPGRWAKQYAQKYPEVAQAQRFIESNASGLARALAGEKGAMAEGDVERAKAMLPNLHTTLKVWPPAQIGIQSPDTRAVALGSMNSIVDMINGRVRAILGNEQFTHPKLHRYETAEEAQTAAGGTVTSPPVEPPGGSPPPPPPAAGPPIFPQPPIREPGAAPAPSTRLTPPRATSTPAHDEAYRRSLAPQPAPAPAQRPAPGRQSQAQPGRRGVELARASGMQVMDMADVMEASQQTGRSPQEVIAAARAKGYRVYGGGGTAMA